MDRSARRQSQARKLRSERGKLILMGVALVVLVLAMVQLAQRSASQGPSDAEQGQAVSRKVSTEAPPMALGAASGEPAALELSPDELGEKFAYMKTDAVYQRIADQDTTLEGAAFLRLLYVVSQEEPAELEAAAEPVDWKTLWDQPQTLRAKPLAIRGTIARIQPVKLPDNPLEIDKVWSYRIRAQDAPRDSQGYLYDVYAIEKLRGALPYDRVTVYARFLKAQIIEPESVRFLQDPDLHVAACVARRLEPLTYLDEPDLPQPIRDGSRPEARAFYYLLHRVRQTRFAQLEAQAREGLTYLDFLNNPERYRGEPVVVQGELRRCVRMALPENILGAQSVYYGQIVDADRKINTFYVTELPERLHLKDAVLCYGYYLKNWTYVSQGNEVLTCPVFVGKRVVRLEYQPSYTFEIVLGAIMVVTVAALFWAYLRDRERQRHLAEARRERQLDRIPGNFNEIARRRAAKAQAEPPLTAQIVEPEPQAPPEEPEPDAPPQDDDTPPRQ